jgi:hypothetical protein
VLTFAKTRHDFGAIPDGGKYTGTFEFRNTGKGKLIIHDIKSTCGCTVPRLDKREFLPGEGSMLDVLFDPTDMKEGIIKTVSVVSNSYRQAVVNLTVSADITPLVRWNSHMLRLETLELGMEHRRSFSGLCLDPTLEITGIEIDNPDIAVELLAVSPLGPNEDGLDEYRALCRLTVADTASWGRVYPNKLTLTARGRARPGDEPAESKYNFLIMGDIYGDLRIDPYAFTPDSLVRLGETFDSSVVLSSASGTYFAVIDAVVTKRGEHDIAVQVEPIDPASYRISIHGTAGARGALKAEVRVRTDVPGEEDLPIRLFGYVK